MGDHEWFPYYEQEVRLETAPTSLGGKARCESRAFSLLSEAGFIGFMGFSGLGNCLNRGLSRITQIARILRIFVYLRFWSGERGYGYWGLRTQTGKFAVQKSRESEFPPMNRRIASTARSYRRMQRVGNRSSLLQKRV